MRRIQLVFLLVAVVFSSMLASQCLAQLSIGAPAPQFALSDQNGRIVKLSDYIGSIVVLEWFNPNCPFVKRHAEAKTMLNLSKRFAAQGVVWLGINSTKETDNGVNLKWSQSHTLPYVLLNDSSGAVGKAYGAKTTPHMFIVDRKGLVSYQGAIDNDPYGDLEIAPINYVADALDDLLKSKPIRMVETKPYGCSVKYAN